MKAAVTGANGFVGACVVRELLERGEQVLALDRQPPRRPKLPLGLIERLEQRSIDITDPDSFAYCLDGVDELYHFAGYLGTSELENNLKAAVDTNIVGTINVFEAALKSDVSRVLFASKPSVWLNTYTITKHCAEQIARLTTRYNPVRISILRYYNIYGPGQKLVPVRKLLPIFAAQALRGLPIQVYGDGLQTVDMIFSRDAARITVDFLRSGYVERPCDCGTGRALPILEVAAAVNLFFGNKAGIQHITMRKGEAPGTLFVADLAPLESVLGNVTTTPWEKGLVETLEWYASKPDHEIDAALAFYGIHQKYGASWN
jgi:UDP-glucose 4-epimerase